MRRLDCTIVGAQAWLAAADATVTPVPLPGTSGLPYERLAATYEPYVARVADTTLLPGNWLLLSDRRELLCEHLHQTLHERPHTRAHHFAAVDGRRVTLDLQPPATAIDEPCVLLGGSPSHYHWLVEFLPRVYAASLVPELRGLRFVVDTGLTPVQEESLRLTGIGADRLLKIDPVRPQPFRTLWVPSLLAETFSLHPAALHWLRTAFLEVAPAAQPGHRLFVSRRDASLRRLVNEDEIAAILAPLGYRTVVGAALGFAEQARAFARAETIVAVAGAGLANMIFAPREATVLELHNIRKGADFFERLAQQLGMRYGRVTGELLPQPAVIANNRDFRVDPVVFRRVMGEVHPGAPA
ncbi:MAG TPA: glycosyltransferase family 61 protein [Burkholderiales bacterium]|nr:glycosyltransferase family 61 protein [Burkholderiales bacterium]